ncbi:MAG: D-alanyl-D-alanine carboxypeptidase/D-alanyl-D-alanine-endopeptidase [Pyrinomonadaceae bacterium]
MKTRRLIQPFVLALFLFASFANAQTSAPKPEDANASSPKAKQSLVDLQTKIAMVLANPSLRRGQVGVKILTSSDGAVVYERNAENYFMPASNMKSFTVAAAIERLGPDFKFRTSVYTMTPPDESGTVKGDLIVYGRGDPSFSGSFNEENQYARFDELADALVAAGVKNVEGSIVGDDSYFRTEPIPSGWEWDDLQWYYGAEVSALTAFDNTIGMKVASGIVGKPALVLLDPYSLVVRIVNKTTTVGAGEKDSLRITKLLGQNVYEISGNVAVGGRGFDGRIAVSKPALYFADVLARRLRLKGVTIKNGVRSIGSSERGSEVFPNEIYSEIAGVDSPPLSLIAQKTMKPSQNLYTELILRALGEKTGSTNEPEASSEKKGIDEVNALLSRAGVEPRSIIQYDGSGLSRHNLITPDAAARLFQYMDRSRNAAVWRNALTIGGVDGTLRNRFKNTIAQNNVRGKTGTIDQVSALSGYVTSRSGVRFVFSVLTNAIPDSRLRTDTIDKIVLALAEYDGELSPNQVTSGAK